MKVFQILGGACHWDASRLYYNAAEAAKHYAPDIVFADAPDYVREGWGFDESKEGDARFVKPTPPEGWLYDDATGTFYQEGELPPNEQPTQLDRIEAQAMYTALLTDTLLKE